MMPLRFVADCTLGKLCKLLRICGFDCRYDDRLPDAQLLDEVSVRESRIVLTRTRRVYARLLPERVLFVWDNDPRRQMRQVVHQLAISRDDLRPLTRCLRCNEELLSISKDDLTGRVPDYVLQHHTHYQGCPRCKRIYWPGSHTQRMLTMAERWFNAPRPYEG